MITPHPPAEAAVEPQALHRASPEASADAILEAAIAILDQGQALLDGLIEPDYTHHIPIAFNASIGGHYRHCLDHFQSFLRGVDQNLLDYDARDRDPDIETNLDKARHHTATLRSAFQNLRSGILNRPIHVRSQVQYSHDAVPETGSTLGRELVYVIAHAIHHYALISVMAQLLAAPLPPHFGVAPSTLRHQSRTPTPEG